jgi:hypothetical protein
MSLILIRCSDNDFETGGKIGSICQIEPIYGSTHLSEKTLQTKRAQKITEAPFSQQILERSFTLLRSIQNTIRKP